MTPIVLSYYGLVRPALVEALLYLGAPQRSIGTLLHMRIGDVTAQSKALGYRRPAGKPRNPNLDEVRALRAAGHDWEAILAITKFPQSAISTIRHQESKARLRRKEYLGPSLHHTYVASDDKFTALMKGKNAR